MKTPDPYYEAKVFAGTLQPAAVVLTSSEIHATVRGRDRGDGRRVDQFVNSGEPSEYGND